MPSIDDNGIECKEMNPFPTVHPQLVCLTALLLPSDVLFPLTIGLRAISAPLSSFNISVNSCFVSLLSPEWPCRRMTWHRCSHSYFLTRHLSTSRTAYYLSQRHFRCQQSAVPSVFWDPWQRYLQPVCGVLHGGNRVLSHSHFFPRKSS
jgi:hypothetical protein